MKNTYVDNLLLVVPQEKVLDIHNKFNYNCCLPLNKNQLSQADDKMLSTLYKNLPYYKNNLHINSWVGYKLPILNWDERTVSFKWLLFLLFYQVWTLTFLKIKLSIFIMRCNCNVESKNFHLHYNWFHYFPKEKNAK